MLNFKKLFIIRIIATIVLITFTVTSTCYGIELPKKTNLRPQLISNSKDGRERLSESLSAAQSSGLKEDKESRGMNESLPLALNLSDKEIVDIRYQNIDTILQAVPNSNWYWNIIRNDDISRAEISNRLNYLKPVVQRILLRMEELRQSGNLPERSIVESIIIHGSYLWHRNKTEALDVDVVVHLSGPGATFEALHVEGLDVPVETVILGTRPLLNSLKSIVIYLIGKLNIDIGARGNGVIVYGKPVSSFISVPAALYFGVLISGQFFIKITALLLYKILQFFNMPEMLVVRLKKNSNKIGRRLIETYLIFGSIINRILHFSIFKGTYYLRQYNKPNSKPISTHFSLFSKLNSHTKEGRTDVFAMDNEEYNITGIDNRLNALPLLAAISPAGRDANITFTIRGPTRGKERTRLIQYIKDNLVNAISRSKSLYEGNLAKNITIVLADKYDYIAGDHRKNNLIILNASDIEAMIQNNEDLGFITELITSILSEELAHERGVKGDEATEQALAEDCVKNTITSLDASHTEQYIGFIKKYGREMDEKAGYLGYLQLLIRSEKLIEYTTSDKRKDNKAFIYHWDTGDVTYFDQAKGISGEDFSKLDRVTIGHFPASSKLHIGGKHRLNLGEHKGSEIEFDVVQGQVTQVRIVKDGRIIKVIKPLLIYIIEDNGELKLAGSCNRLSWSRMMIFEGRRILVSGEKVYVSKKDGTVSLGLNTTPSSKQKMPKKWVTLEDKRLQGARFEAEFDWTTARKNTHADYYMSRMRFVDEDGKPTLDYRGNPIVNYLGNPLTLDIRPASERHQWYVRRQVARLYPIRERDLDEKTRERGFRYAVFDNITGRWIGQAEGDKEDARYLWSEVNLDVLDGSADSYLFWLRLSQQANLFILGKYLAYFEPRNKAAGLLVKVRFLYREPVSATIIDEKDRVVNQNGKPWSEKIEFGKLSESHESYYPADAREQRLLISACEAMLDLDMLIALEKLDTFWQRKIPDENSILAEILTEAVKFGAKSVDVEMEADRLIEAWRNNRIGHSYEDVVGRALIYKSEHGKIRKTKGSEFLYFFVIWARALREQTDFKYRQEDIHRTFKRALIYTYTSSDELNQARENGVVNVDFALLRRFLGLPQLNPREKKTLASVPKLLLEKGVTEALNAKFYISAIRKLGLYPVKDEGYAARLEQCLYVVGIADEMGLVEKADVRLLKTIVNGSRILSYKIQGLSNREIGRKLSMDRSVVGKTYNKFRKLMGLDRMPASLINYRNASLDLKMHLEAAEIAKSKDLIEYDLSPATIQDIKRDYRDDI
nr:hypothetical protein [Candidatus Omnitrophota bacterium]